jgi:hypothetical protein
VIMSREACRAACRHVSTRVDVQCMYALATGDTGQRDSHGTQADSWANCSAADVDSEVFSTCRNVMHKHRGLPGERRGQ